MASVKISELNSLISITTDDFIPIVDSGSGTTYRVTFNTFNTWASTLGSSSYAAIADSASAVTSASYALTASYVSSSLSASYALTASYFDLTGVSPSSVTSASYATTASVLQGRGTSWERDLQISQSLKFQRSAWLEIPRKINYSTDDRLETIWFHGEYGADAGSDDYVRVYFSEEVSDAGRLVFEHGDNVDTLASAGPNIDYQGRNNPGFLWQTFESGTSGSMMFLKTDGKLYLRSAEARDFSASFEAKKVGFYGTASQALTSSYLLSGGPAASQMPWMVENLWIYPYFFWFHYSPSDTTAYRRIQISARSVVVHNSSGDTIQIFNINQINDKNIIDAPGGRLGTFVSQRWHDIFVIYNSTTREQSTIIKYSGDEPGGLDFANDIYPDLSAAGYAEWDHGHLVGSAWTANQLGRWDKWMEYGAKTQFAVHGYHPTSYGMNRGYNVEHNLGQRPRQVRVVNKVRTDNLSHLGLPKGAEVPAWCFISDVDITTEGQPYLVIPTDTHVKLGWSRSDNGWECHDYYGNFLENTVTDWAMVIYATT